MKNLRLYDLIEKVKGIIEEYDAEIKALESEWKTGPAQFSYKYGARSYDVTSLTSEWATAIAGFLLTKKQELILGAEYLDIEPVLEWNGVDINDHLHDIKLGQKCQHLYARKSLLVDRMHRLNVMKSDADHIEDIVEQLQDEGELPVTPA